MALTVLSGTQRVSGARKRAAQHMLISERGSEGGHTSDTLTDVTDPPTSHTLDGVAEEKLSSRTDAGLQVRRLRAGVSAAAPAL